MNDFNPASIWPQIEAVPSPGPMSRPSPADFAALRPSQAALTLRSQRLLCLLKAVPYSAGVCIVCWILIPHSILWLLGYVLGMHFYFMAVYEEADSGPVGRQRIQLKKALNSAQKEMEALEARWREEAEEELFFQLRRELLAKKIEYEALPALYQQRWEYLTTRLRTRQLIRFLEQYDIADANIRSLQPHHIENLKRRGIETAADVTAIALKYVEDIDSVLRRNLLSWRTSIQQDFVLDVDLVIDPEDARQLQHATEGRRSTLEQQLKDGPAQLSQAAHQITAQRRHLSPLLQTADHNVAQLAIDYKRVDQPFSRL